MSLLRSIVFTSLFCLLFCSTELYALSSNELKLEKQKTTLSLDGLGKSLNGTMKGVGESFDGTVKGIGKSLDGTAKGIGEFLDGTVKGVGESLGGTVDGIGVFLEENGEAIIAVGLVALFVIADCYCYDNGHYHSHGYDHDYHR
jgi:hypothetical protein